LITYNLKDEEILTVGKYKGFEFTKEKLKEIYDNFYKLKNEVKPTIKLGHGEQDILGRSGFPAAGYITDLKLSENGESLYANLQDVPKEVKELIDAKAYNRKSAEVILSYEDPNKGNEKFGTVLCGLALLGEEMPEIKTLEDIKKLYYSDETNKVELITLSSKEEVKMAEEIKKDALSGEQAAPVVTEQVEEKMEEKEEKASVPAEEVVMTVDAVVTQLEKIIEALYGFLEGAVETDDLMLSRAEKSVMKLAEGLKKKKKKEDEVKMAEAPKKEVMPEEKPKDETVTKLSDMENKIKMLEMEVTKANQKAKDAEIEKLNFSDENYIESLVKEGKVLPVQKDELKKLFFSINKKEANIIMLSDTEKIDIKESIKNFINSNGTQIDLSDGLTKNIAEMNEKKPEEIQLGKVKEQFKEYFQK